MGFRAAYLRWLIVALGGLVVLIAAVILALPWLLDVPAIRAQIEHQVSKAVNGAANWRSLEVRLLPVPRAVLEGARVDVSGVLSGTVEAVELELRLQALMLGRAEVRSIVIVRPALRVKIPTGSAESSAPAKDPMVAYRSAMEPAVRILRQVAPDTTLSVQDGRLEVEAAGFPPIAATAINLRARTDATGVALEGAMAGQFWDNVTLNARLDYPDLKAKVEMDASGLKPQTVLDRFLADLGSGIEIPSIALQVKAGTDGRSAFDFAVALNAPRAVVRFGSRQIEVVEASVQSVLVASGANVELALTDVHLGELVPSGRAKLRFEGVDHRPQLAVEIDSLDLARLRDTAMAILGDQPKWRDYFARIRAGRLADVRVSATSDSFATLFDVANLHASLALDQAVLRAPVIEQEVQGIGAHLEFASNTLRVQGAKARLGASSLAAGELTLGLNDLAIDSKADLMLDLPQMLELTRAVLPRDQRRKLAAIRSVQGSIRGQVAFTSVDRRWQAKVDVARSDAVVRTRMLPFPIKVREAHVTVSPGQIALTGLDGSVGATALSQGRGEVVLVGPPKLKSAGARVEVAVAEIYSWLRSQPALARNLERISGIEGQATVILNDLNGRLDQPGRLAFDASVEPHALKVEGRDWPALTADGGSIRITPDAVVIDKVGAHVLDGGARLSGRIDDYREQRRGVVAAAEGGTIGHELVAWIWRRADLPGRLVPATPAQFFARRIAWRDGKLDIAAEVHGEARPAIGVDLTVAPGAFELRNLTIKDAATDATLRAATRGRLVDVTFKGVLESRSVAAMLQHAAKDYGGKLHGDLSLTLDRDRQGRAEARGRVVAENINVGRVLPWPLRLERADIEGAGGKLIVRELTLDFADQKATVRGEIERKGYGAAIKAEVDSPGIVVDALLPAPKPTGTEVEPKAAEADEAPAPFRPWPLKVTGTLAVNAGFVQWRRFRVEPLRAQLVLEEQRAELLVREASLCGVAFPFSLIATPDGLDAAVKLSASQQELGTVTRCVGGEDVALTGTFDLSARLAAKGRPKDLLRNLEGPLTLRARDGVIRKFALLGNILALKDVTGTFKKGVNLGAEGFGYQKLEVRGRFANGAYKVEEGALDSSALGIAANGSVDLTGDKSRLTVLVAPFGRIDRLVRKLPVVGYVFGGTFTSIPVGVSGNIRNPLVVPLGPGAVTSELTGIFERTLKLPGRLLKPADKEGQEP